MTKYSPIIRTSLAEDLTELKLSLTSCPFCLGLGASRLKKKECVECAGTGKLSW